MMNSGDEEKGMGAAAVRALDLSKRFGDIAAVDGMTAHLHLLNALLHGRHITSVGSIGRFLITVSIASLAAWCLLRFRGSNGLALARTSPPHLERVARARLGPWLGTRTLP